MFHNHVPQRKNMGIFFSPKKFYINCEKVPLVVLKEIFRLFNEYQVWENSFPKINDPFFTDHLHSMSHKHRRRSNPQIILALAHVERHQEVSHLCKLMMESFQLDILAYIKQLHYLFFFKLVNNLVSKIIQIYWNV